MARPNQDREGLFSPLLSRWRLGRVLAHIPPAARVLDGGCGSGRLCTLLPAGCCYVGADTAPPTQREGAGCDTVFVAADLTADEDLARLREQGPFDVIVLSAVVEHFDDPAGLLQRLAPYLAPDGAFVLTTPSPRIRRLHEFGGRLGLFSRHGAEQHKLLLDRAALEELAARAGLHMAAYETFQFGLNQLAVLRPAARDA